MERLELTARSASAALALCVQATSHHSEFFPLRDLGLERKLQVAACSEVATQDKKVSVILAAV